LIRSIGQSASLIRGADLVVGFGGYVSGPAYLAAFLTRTPFVIHEANAKPGLANVLGSLFTPHSAIAYPVARGPLSKSLIAGLPLRRDVHEAFASASRDWKTARIEAKKSLGFDPHKPLIFAFGGSQGSAAINEVIFSSRSYLTEHSIQILHGVGARNSAPESSQDYHGVTYISDMATAYLAADLIISRSGAVTCAEVNTLGRYALFIPLPIGNGEQKLNAQSLISQHRGTVVEQKTFSAQWLQANISDLLHASAGAPIEGSRTDIDAATKMVALMEEALTTTGGK
jgi:UDP-N-acetylglucosamine--N-acetylmuramyl-(pentapeptide) pyrophosphoryl-undecaprenol N-acetylglucosamine transferase